MIELSKERNPTLRARIMDQTLHLITRNGVDCSSIDEIATAANVSSGSIYRHFGSKRQLIDEVVIYALDLIKDCIVSAVQPSLPATLADAEQRILVAVTTRRNIIEFDLARLWLVCNYEALRSKNMQIELGLFYNNFDWYCAGLDSVCGPSPDEVRSTEIGRRCVDSINGAIMRAVSLTTVGQRADMSDRALQIEHSS